MTSYLLCPFCGKVAAKAVLRGKGWRVDCVSCRSNGPIANDPQLARDIWQRVIPASSTSNKPEDGWLAHCKALRKRIEHLEQRERERDSTLKLEMVERAKLAERCDLFEDWVRGKLEFDTTHDHEGEQDG